MRASAAPDRVAVLGAGTMGGGIAVVFACAGSEVRLAARHQSSLDAAKQRIRDSLRLLVDAGELEQHAALDAADRVRTTTSLERAVETADLVVETIPEDPDRKRELLEHAERLMRRDAILATDTSSLRIAELAGPLKRPQAFAGFHWFNPPELVKLVEVVAGPRTAAKTTRRLLDWSRAIGKRAVLVQRDVEGFIANRLQYALFREAYALVEAGVCDYAAVDEAVKAGLGPRWAAVGPFESMDLAGLDVHYDVARRLFPDLASTHNAPETVRRLVEEGALGCKSGRGLYGEYTTDAIGRLRERRAEILLGLARMERARQARGEA